MAKKRLLVWIRRFSTLGVVIILALYFIGILKLHSAVYFSSFGGPAGRTEGLFLDPSCLLAHKQYPFCSKCFTQQCSSRELDTTSIKKELKWLQQQQNDEISAQIRTCESLVSNFCFPSKPYSEEERQYPLAFIILAYKELDRILKLFQSIYWPQNAYCINIDATSPKEYHDLAGLLARCFPRQVVVVNPAMEMRWSSYTIIKAQLRCLQLLYQRFPKWKYVMALTGRDLPLRTNSEMVQICKRFGGYSDVSVGTRYTEYRRIRHCIGPPPINITKGGAGFILSRALVKQVLYNDKLKNFTTWLRNTSVPDEFFGSVGFAEGIEGTIPFHLLPFLLRRQAAILAKMTHFLPQNTTVQWPLRRALVYHQWNRTLCGGHFTTDHGCAYGLADLRRIAHRPEFVAHRFSASHWPMAYECYRQYFLNRTWDIGQPAIQGWKFNKRFYDIYVPALYSNLNRNNTEY